MNLLLLEYLKKQDLRFYNMDKSILINPLKEVVNLRPDVAQITWVMNNICSNQCTYCLPGLYAGTNHNYEWKNAKKFIEIVLKKYGKTHWSVSGGEPTMSPFFKEFIEIIKENGSSVGITTNGVKPVKYMSEIANNLHYIAYSYHPEYTDDTAFIEKVLTTNHISPSPIRVMMHANQELWDKSMKFINRIRKNPTISYESVKVQPYPGVHKFAFDYTKEQLQWFNNPLASYQSNQPHFPRKPETIGVSSNYIDIHNNVVHSSQANAVEWINRKYTNFNKWSCNIGLESLFIGTTGDIERGNCLVGGYIGHIDKPDEVNWPTKPITCNIDLCHCATDVQISKKRPKNINPLI